jgi:hypothetical protein
MSQHAKGFALVTGASSGIGAIYADRLAGRGRDLILVARSVDRLRALADKIADETGRKDEVIAADLGKRKDLAKVEAALRTDERITTLGLNVDALTRLTYAAAPGFVGRWYDHHYRLDRCRGAGVRMAQRRLQCLQGVCARLEPVA